MRYGILRTLIVIPYLISHITYPMPPFPCLSLLSVVYYPHMHRFEILTLFPDVIDTYASQSILGIGQRKKKLRIRAHNIRHAATDKHQTVDDKPYGGGPGMVMMVEPIAKTLNKIRRTKKSRVLVMDPAGKRFDQAMAKRYQQQYDQLIFICGRYEGIDERVMKLADERVSVGPYVLAGGELPALIITEAVSRLVPGVLGAAASLDEETFTGSEAEYPHYTRPEVFIDKKTGKKMKVPPVLLSGNHADILAWRQSKKKKG